MMIAEWQTNPRHAIYNRRQVATNRRQIGHQVERFVLILIFCYIREIKLTPCARVVRKYTRYSLPNHLPRCRLIIKNAICDSLISISQGLKDDWSSSTYVTILCKCWTSLNSFTWTFFSRKDGQHHWSPRVGLP